MKDPCQLAITWSREEPMPWNKQKTTVQLHGAVIQPGATEAVSRRTSPYLPIPSCSQLNTGQEEDTS